MNQKDMDLAALRTIAGLEYDGHRGTPNEVLAQALGVEPPEIKRPNRAYYGTFERRIREKACEYLAERMAEPAHTAEAGTDTETADPSDPRELPVRIRIAIPDETVADGYRQSEHDLSARILSKREPTKKQTHGAIMFSMTAEDSDNQEWIEGAKTALHDAINKDRCATGVRSFAPEASNGDQVGSHDGHVSWAAKGNQMQHEMLGLAWPPAELPDLELDPESPGPR